MGFPIPLKPRLTYFLLKGFWLSAAVAYPAMADNDSAETIGNLSARIEELENRLNEQGDGHGAGLDDKNPGARVTFEDLERLRDEIRALKETRQTPIEDIERLRDDVRNLREDMSQLQHENAALRLKNSPGKVGAGKTSAPLSGSSETKPGTQPAPMDDETESVLKLLEQSAPGDEEEAESVSGKKRNKASKDLEMTREMATRRAEEAAPALPVGDVEAQYNEAFALYDKGAYKEAERAFAYFLETYPDDPLVAKAMYWQGECCLKQEKYDGAKVLFVNAYKKNPKGPKAPHCLLRLGEVLAIQGKNEDAQTAWKKLKVDFPHMTDEMKNKLAALTKKYGGDKKPKAASKTPPKSQARL